MMEKVKKTGRGRNIAVIVLAAVIVLVVGALAFAGNYLFHLLSVRFDRIIKMTESGQTGDYEAVEGAGRKA